MIVRTDLPPEQQTVQACHAAYEAGLRLPTPSTSPDDASDADPDYSVICAVDSEQKLLEAHRHLLRQQIPTVLFTEADLDDQATALASAPVKGEQRKAFARFRLWTPAAAMVPV